MARSKGFAGAIKVATLCMRTAANAENNRNYLSRLSKIHTRLYLTWTVDVSAVGLPLSSVAEQTPPQRETERNRGRRQWEEKREIKERDRHTHTHSQREVRVLNRNRETG